MTPKIIKILIDFNNAFKIKYHDSKKPEISNNFQPWHYDFEKHYNFGIFSHEVKDKISQLQKTLKLQHFSAMELKTNIMTITNLRFSTYFDIKYHD